VTSGPSRDTTTNNNNNNNNNGPAGDSAGLDVSRDSNDVTLDQGARPSPAAGAGGGGGGKRSSSRKAAAVSGGSSGRVAARPAPPSHGELTVESTGAGQSRRAAAGKLSISATNSPAAGPTAVSAGNTSSTRKQQTTSASLTDVAGGGTESGKSSPELLLATRRRAIPASRLGAVSRGRPPPRIARPASDGGGADTRSAACYRGALGSRLPSVVTGSVGAINDRSSGSGGGKPTVLTSFKPSQHQQSSKSGHHRLVAPTSSSSSSSPLRLMDESSVQSGVGPDTHSVVAADLTSPLASGSPPATRETADDTQILPVGHEDLHRVPDKPSDRQSPPNDPKESADVSDWSKSSEEHEPRSPDCQNEEQNLLTTTDMLTVNKTVLDEPEYSQNLVVDHKRQQSVPDGREICQTLIDKHAVSQTLPTEQKCHQSFVGGELEKRTAPNVTEDQKHQQSSVDTELDTRTVPVGHTSPEGCCYQLNNASNKHQLVVGEDTAVASYRLVGRTTSCDDDVIADVTSCSDVILPPPAKPAPSVLMTTTGATQSTDTATATGEYIF